MPNTELQFDNAIARCRDIFAAKLKDYGPSWRLMRPQSITDQIFIKANRVRSLEVKGESWVGEGILPEFIAMVNYGIIGLIQLEKGYSDAKDLTSDEALALYDSHMAATRTLMLAKNHDYDEAWRLMRVSSYTDLILTKLMRTKEIEDNNGQTNVSEGIDANYMDIINYAVFGIIKLTADETSER
ncbi:MAG: DUF1599 domain-containing protein [Muribaculaceae bacterium]|nr:DUF1599 domain-containing protein [Muribaculaceae bacterium]